MGRDWRQRDDYVSTLLAVPYLQCMVDEVAQMQQ